MPPAACTARYTRFSGRISVSIIRVERETKREIRKNKRGKREKKTNTGVGLAEVTGTRAKSFLRPTVVYITGG